MAADLTILHLSDLQFGRHHRYPRDKDSYQTLLSKLSEDLDHLAEAHKVQPNAIVVTGDIAQTSVPDEYDQARVFLDGLMAKLKIGNERVVLVPGNHDINRPLCAGARQIARGRQQTFREPYFPKFEHYQRFFNAFYGHIKRFDDANLWQVYDLRDEKIIVVGFNSCMKESERKKDHYGWIGLEQVHEAIRRCNEIDPHLTCLRIGAMHHNFLAESLEARENLRDEREIRRALEDGAFSLLLHGHLHIAVGEQRKSFTAKVPLTIVGTGSAGLDGKSLPEHPNQYQIVRIQNGNDVTLYMRQYSTQSFGMTGQGEWIPDGRLRDNGVVPIQLGRDTQAPAAPTGTTAARLAKARNEFLAFMREEHRLLPLRGFGTDFRVPIELEPMYVALRAVPAHFETEPSQRRQPPVRLLEEMEISEALRFCERNQYSGMVILGEPGSGKTTILKHLALCLAGSKLGRQTGIKRRRLPLYLPLREVKDFDTPLAQALQSYYAKSWLNLPPDFFDLVLQSGRCLLLLDGLDEVATPEARQKASEWIERERHTGRGNPIVVTSRFAGYKGAARLPGNYLEMHVRDFSDEDVKRFVRQWYTQVETKQPDDTPHSRDEARRLSQDLIAQLERHEQQRVRDLATNPLMLQIICIVHRSQGAVSKRRTELYNKCMDVLLQDWDKAKGLEVLLTATEARIVLRPLALWLHSEEERTYAEVEDVRKQLLPHLKRVKRELKDVEHQLDRLLTSVRDRSGLFTGYDITRYGFQHLSFQEFLAAEEIAKTGRHEQLVGTFGRSWWREPTLLALGLDDPRFQEAFFVALVRDPVFADNLDFALACVREAMAPSVKPFADALTDPTLDWKARHHCVILLREMGGAEVVDPLEKALNDPNPKVASAAQDALVKLGVLKQPPVLRAGTIVNSKDSTELILITSGEFLMGSDKGDSNERPERRVYLDAYYIAKHPVTNAQYRRFMEATKHREPYMWDDKRFNKPNQPVVGVTWHDAEAYCKWAGLRLPTEAEWEKAARGEDGRIWPWGNDPPNDKRCNFNGNVGATTEVGSYPEGASPYGCLDIAGNVGEWCQDWYGPYDKSKTRNPKGPAEGPGKVLRGGAFYSKADSVRCSRRGWGPPGIRDHGTGFRCAQ